MINKRYIAILLLLIVSICTISAVSASDDSTDIISSDYSGSDVVSNLNEDLNEAPIEETADDEGLANVVSEDNLAGLDDVSDLNSVETNDQEDLASSNEDESLSMQVSNEVLSYSAPSASDYNVTVYNGEISASNGGVINLYVQPSANTKYRPYDFYVCAYKTRTLSGNVYYFSDRVYISSNQYSSSEDDRAPSYYTFNFAPGTFSLGTYYVTIENFLDDKIMSHSVLTVVENVVISSWDYKAKYNEGKKMSIKVTDKSSGKAKSSIVLKVVFSNGKKTVTKYYTTDSSGYASFIPPVGIGTYTVAISPANSYVKGSAIKKTAALQKAKASVKAFKVSTYKGFKITLKATVKSSKRNVNEGKVTFKVNGKTYKVKVKNGVATKKLKLKKVKTYKYTAKFSSSNFYSSKKSKNKATVKKRYGTKIIVKTHHIYSNEHKVITIKVLTKSGKKVKGGKLKIKFVDGTGYYKVKNGKSRVSVYGLGNQHLRWYNGVTSSYKKYIRKTLKFKYIPSTHKYIGSSKKVKFTSQFRCNCGRKTTHNHYGHSYGYAYGNVNTYVTDRVIIS